MTGGHLDSIRACESRLFLSEAGLGAIPKVQSNLDNAEQQT